MKLLFSSTAAGGRSGWRSWPWAGRVVRGENSEHLWGGSDRWWPKFSAGRREEIFYVRDYFRWVSRDAILILWFPPEHHVTKQFCHLVPHAPESYTLNSVGLTPDWILLVWRQIEFCWSDAKWRQVFHSIHVVTIFLRWHISCVIMILCFSRP